MFEQMMPGLIRDRGYDYNAIQLVFATAAISRHRQAIYMDMITAVIDVIQKARKAQ